MTANWKNRTLFHHDNLAVLRGMNSESVDLIATDPPFNKSKDFHAMPDSLAAGTSFQDRWSWEKDVHEEWTDQLEIPSGKLASASAAAFDGKSKTFLPQASTTAVRRRSF